MLTAKRLAGVTPEVNLRNPLHKAYKWGIHPGFETQRRHPSEVQDMAISGPTKKDLCPPKIKKNIVSLFCVN